MQTRGRRVNRWLAAVAAALIALGSTFVIVGSASASAPVGHFPVIRFWPNYNVVTMTVPLRVWCPKSKPFCEWQLYVNEPDIPSQTLVGTATGTSGILTVKYPKHFCGVIQADALVGPSPWLFQFGHKKDDRDGAQRAMRAPPRPPSRPTPPRPPRRPTPRRPPSRPTPPRPPSHRTPRRRPRRRHTTTETPRPSSRSPRALGRRWWRRRRTVSTTSTKANRRPAALHRRRHPPAGHCRSGADPARLLHPDDARTATAGDATDGVLDAVELGGGHGHPYLPMVPGRLSRGRCHSCGAAG